MSIESKIVYFEKAGEHNTEEVFQIVKKRAEELGVKTILVASTSGETAAKAVKALGGLRVIAVGFATGMREPNAQPFKPEHKQTVESRGGIVLNTTHTLAGLSASVRNKYNAPGFAEVIADTLRIFGHGMKVAVEIAMMATDSGLVHTDEDIISIGGRSSGADTAILLKPVNANRFFDLQVREILCKPHL
jgi:hypothetical protein